MSWGATWGTGWSGGGATPGVLPATSSLRFNPVTYRRPIGREPVGAAERKIELHLLSARNDRQVFGNGRTILTHELRIRASYTVLGGDAGGGDRQSVMIRALEDGKLIADTWTDSRNWAAINTDIVQVRLLTASALVIDAKQMQTWECRFEVEIWHNWPL